MVGTIEIEVDDDGKMNTNSEFDLATTAVVLEKVKQQIVKRAQLKKQEGAEEAEEDEE